MLAAVMASPAPPHRLARFGRSTGALVVRAAGKAWDDSIFSKSAAGAFWQTLSLPPLLLGLLGMLGYVEGWLGADAGTRIRNNLVSVANTVFSDQVVHDIITPSIDNMLSRGRADIVSLSFLLSLWAGSSAISSFVDAICDAHGQLDHRNPVWQRLFALLLYVAFLVLATVTLPAVAIGPSLLGQVLPDAWHAGVREAVRLAYPPIVFVVIVAGVLVLYRLALPRPPRWRRLLGGAVFATVFFFVSTTLLRLYLVWITSTGYSYGALATPIAYLLFAFFLGFSIIIGAELNAAADTGPKTTDAAAADPEGPNAAA